MSDLVERLRKGWGFCSSDDTEEAADEIERLTKQCEGLAQSAMNNGQDLLLKEAEVARLKKILDGTERRESEYLALIEKHATEIDAWKEAWLKLQIENNNLMHERHTTKQMLEDVIRHHCVGTITPPATPPNKRSA